MPGCTLLCLPGSFKAVLAFTAGTGVHVAKCQLFQSAPFANNQPVAWTHVADFLFGGSPSIDQAFGGAPSANSPFLLETDALEEQLDSRRMRGHP